MFSVTGPVTTRPSACRGEATNLDAETAEVEDNRAQDVEIRLARPAATGTHLTKLERPAEKPAGLFVQGVCKLQRASIANQILASPRGQAIFLGVANGALGARLRCTPCRIGIDPGRAGSRCGRSLWRRSGTPRHRHGIRPGTWTCPPLADLETGRATTAPRPDRQLSGGPASDAPAGLAA